MVESKKYPISHRVSGVESGGQPKVEINGLKVAIGSEQVVTPAQIQRQIEGASDEGVAGGMGEQPLVFFVGRTGSIHQQEPVISDGSNQSGKKRKRR